jgi:hypothetical protein
LTVDDISKKVKLGREEEALWRGRGEGGAGGGGWDGSKPGNKYITDTVIPDVELCGLESPALGKLI